MHCVRPGLDVNIVSQKQGKWCRREMAYSYNDELSVNQNINSQRDNVR